jgi:hypothetical protein
MNSAIQKEVQNRPEVKLKVALGKEKFWEGVRAGLRPEPSLGHKWTEEQKKANSDKQKGENGYWYGKNGPCAKSVINTTTGQEFRTMKEAAESVNGNYRSLSKAIKRNRKYKKNKFVLKQSLDRSLSS